MGSVYNVKDISEALMPVFLDYHIKRAVLFGSYSKGTASVSSDIDLVVDSGLRGLKFVGLIEAIRQALGKDVDVMDITHIENNSKIENEIKSNGVIIYEE